MALDHIHVPSDPKALLRPSRASAGHMNAIHRQYSRLAALHNDLIDLVNNSPYKHPVEQRRLIQYGVSSILGDPSAQLIKLDRTDKFKAIEQALRVIASRHKTSTFRIYARALPLADEMSRQWFRKLAEAKPVGNNKMLSVPLAFSGLERLLGLKTDDVPVRRMGLAWPEQSQIVDFAAARRMRDGNLNWDLRRGTLTVPRKLFESEAVTREDKIKQFLDKNFDFTARMEIALQTASVIRATRGWMGMLTGILGGGMVASAGMVVAGLAYSNANLTFPSFGTVPKVSERQAPVLQAPNYCRDARVMLTESATRCVKTTREGRYLDGDGRVLVVREIDEGTIRMAFNAPVKRVAVLPVANNDVVFAYMQGLAGAPEAVPAGQAPQIYVPVPIRITLAQPQEAQQVVRLTRAVPNWSALSGQAKLGLLTQYGLKPALQADVTVNDIRRTQAISTDAMLTLRQMGRMTFGRGSVVFEASVDAPPAPAPVAPRQTRRRRSPS